jgi:hypothetical protein
MQIHRSALVVAALLAVVAPGFAAGPDPNAGEKLVQANGCTGCHGAKFEGGIGPKLLGVEHRLSAEKIADAILHPKAPMPQFGFTQAQADNITAYLSGLDGGERGSGPVATLTPATPTSSAVLSVRFAVPPKSVTADASMQMGHSPMHAPLVTLKPTADPHVWSGTVEFAMGGAWTIVVTYDGKTMNVPVAVGGSGSQ